MKKIQKFISSEFNPVVFLIFVAIMGIAGYFVIFSRAAPPAPTVYLTPETKTLTTGETFTVQVREDSGATTVNAIQATFNYPATLLDFVSIDATGSGFPVEAEATGGSGKVSIARGIIGTVTGDQLVATVTFKVKTTAGSVNLAFADGTALVESVNNTNILSSLAATGGATFTIKPPTVYLTPKTKALNTGETFTVQVREDSGAHTVNSVQANFSYPATLLDFVSISASGSAFPVEAEATGGSGSVRIGRGIIGTVTGDQLIATVTFKVKTTVGTANLAFVAGTALVESANNTDILVSLANTGGATYNIASNPPTVSLSSPANGSTVGVGTPVVITAIASSTSSSVSKVEIYVDGGLKTTLTNSPYNYTWSTVGVNLGAHTIFAKAYDSFNNAGTSSTINVTVADQTAPTASITAPSGGSFVSGSAVTLSASASDNIGVSGVQFKVDGTNVGAEDTTSPYSIAWNSTTVSNASHNITAVARDAAGNTTTSSVVAVTVDNAAPTVSITSPTAGATVSNTVSVTASASDNTGGSGLAKVEFYVDGVLKFTDNSSPYSFSWDTKTATDGSHSLTAKAFDNVSLSTTSSARTVTVSNVDSSAPTTPGSLRSTGTTLTTISLAWNASTDNVGVTGYQVKRNGTLVTTTTSLNFTDANLSHSTSYSYTVTAVDAANNLSTPAGPLSVSTQSLKPGDVNLDNKVDLVDLSIMLTKWGTSDSACDINSNGTVEIYDLSILLSNYGT